MAEHFVNLLLLNEIQRPAARRVYGRRRNPFNELSDVSFVKLFRLTKEVCRILIAIITPYFEPEKRPTDIDLNTKVLLALRFYAAGSYQMDVASNKFFCVSQSTASRCIKDVTEVLNRPEIFNRFVKFPVTIAELNDVRTRFYHEFQFPGIIGIIDCTHIAIVPPAANDPERPEHLYVNRKHYHSLNVQLICDNNLKIVNVNASFPGSTHDSDIWQASNVSRFLCNLHLGGQTGYHLLGDSGYPLRPWLMVPLADDLVPGTPEHRFNSRFKSIRTTAGRIVNVCVILHNLCIDHNVPEVLDDLPQHPDFGLYANEINVNENVEDNMRRANPELVQGRVVRNLIIRQL